MSIYRLYLLILSFLCAFENQLHAQAEFHLRLQDDGETYTAYVRSQTDWLPPLNSLVHSARVTVVSPANGLIIDNLHSLLGQWHLTHVIEQPLENPGADYFLFEMVGAVADTIFIQDVEKPLFSFENNRTCPGAFELMDMETDPFVLFNMLNLPIGQSMVVEGAGGEAYTGNYGAGQADCMAYLACDMSIGLELLPSGYYEILLHTGNNLPVQTAIQSLKVALKVPTNLFRIRDLTNLQSGNLAFFGVMRFDAPIEEPGFDYIVINMAGVGGQPVSVSGGVTLPLMQFGNGGSCQGDSIFLVQNSGDPFFSPNSQNAVIGQQVLLENAAFPEPVCVFGSGSAPCLGCSFTDDLISIDVISANGPILCLGQTNGTIHLSAVGADSLTYSINGGQTWQVSPVFNNLPIGTYQPYVRGSYYGCLVETIGSPVMLAEETQVDLQLGVPEKACEGDDLALQIVSPVSMPLSTNYTWSGPLGFSAVTPDPVLFAVNVFQSGLYSLVVQVPGCDVATATTEVEVVQAIDVPTLISNAPICRGEPLVLTTDVQGEKFEWIGPAGQSVSTLAIPGLTTPVDTTILPSDHPAYLPGNWKIRLTDNNGCVVESAFNDVAIKDRPQAFAANNGPVCLGKEALLSAVSMPGAIYRWRQSGNPAVFSYQAEPVVPNITSEMTFELEVELAGCTSENTAITTVSLHPKPSVFPLFNYQVAPDCAPEDVQLIANASGVGLTYDWSGVNGFNAQVENPVISNANSQSNGSYQLKVTNIHGCTAVTPFEITGVEDAIPTPVIQSTGSVCPGEDMVLAVTPYNNPQVTYLWFKNGTQIAGATSSSLHLDAVEPGDAGMYHIKVQVGSCQVESADLWVQVLPKPVSIPDFILSFPCEGSTLQLLANSSNIVNWNWTGPNGFTSNAQNPVLYNTEFDDVGSYSLIVTAANGCTAAASTLVDGILPVPEVPHVASNSPVCPEDEILLVVQNPTLLGTVSYAWFNGLGDYVGDGSEMLELSPSDPLAVPPFLVKKNVNGCESGLSDPIPVEVKPMPIAEAESSGAVCPGETVQLIAAPVDEATYTWHHTGTSQVVSFVQNPLLTINQSTEYELTVQINGCDAMAVDTTVALVWDQPVINGLTGGGSYCEGTAVQLSGEGIFVAGDVQYTWTGPAGFHFTNTANATGPFTVNLGVLQSQGEGAYTLQLESAEGCGSVPQSVVVDLVEMPDPPVITISSDLLCEGEDLQLDATGYPGNNVQYDWFFNDGNGVSWLGTTTSSTFFINGVLPADSGIYFVQCTVEGCVPPVSNSIQVNVIGIGDNVVATNPTTINEPVCEGEDVQLEATLVPGAAYAWYGPAGFQASGNSPVITDIPMNATGNYFVEITMPGCSNVLTAFTPVFVKPRPVEPILSGPTEVCSGNDVTIAVTNAQPGAAYHFYFTQNNTLVETSADPAITIPQIIEGQSGDYFAVAEVDGCQSEDSQWFALQVVPREEVTAYAGAGQVVCDENEEVSLSGNVPVVGTGLWLSIQGGRPEQPNQVTTNVYDLITGENYFIWEISHPVCDYISVDTTLIFLEEIIAHPDVEELTLSDTILLIDVLLNDEIVANGWDVQILERPDKGNVTMDADGQVTYRPYPKVFGEDSFVYEICSMTCPEVCSVADVQLRIGNTQSDASDCFVPNLISPNGDGENDVFIVPCAAVFAGSELVVVNRYGTPVYQNPNYQNDWGGTYEGDPLPVGTYFYQLSLNDDAGTVLQGYVAVLR